WRDLANTQSNTATDDPSDVATPDNISAGRDIALRQIRTMGWSSAKLSAELAGDDPQRRIAERVAAYWSRQFQRILVATLNGVFADNIANDSSDMVNVTGAAIDAEAILDTKQTMGDAADDLDTLIMHSVVYTSLQKQNLIDFIPDSEGKVRFPTYLGYRVVVDDGVNVNTNVYDTYLVANGALAWAEVPVATPVETDHFPAQGNGMGVDQLWTRRQFVMHPYGIAWQDDTVTDEFPTNAELATASNWDRVYPERKQIGLALLRTTES